MKIYVFKNMMRNCLIFSFSRPAPVYPQPRVDQSAAKCRRDICSIPDCNCGGKEVPGTVLFSFLVITEI